MTEINEYMTYNQEKEYASLIKKYSSRESKDTLENIIA
jgi:hypothetical protein